MYTDRANMKKISHKILGQPLEDIHNEWWMYYNHHIQPVNSQEFWHCLFLLAHHNFSSRNRTRLDPSWKSPEDGDVPSDSDKPGVFECFRPRIKRHGKASVESHHNASSTSMYLLLWRSYSKLYGTLDSRKEKQTPCTYEAKERVRVSSRLKWIGVPESVDCVQG